MEGGGGITTSVDSPTIRPINKGVVHRICSGQVILDLSSAVKELVENSLDAGATSIEIALKEYGRDWFQVVDNGSGISPHNFKVLALKYHTSKLANFPDLQSLATFGFRGEALSSLCALGDLTVETRTKNEQVATHLTFDRWGSLIAEKKTARQIGTTVIINKLFSNLPVRCKEFHRNIRKEFGKLVSLLNAYAIIAKGVRLVCTNTTEKNVKSVVLKTQGSGFLKDNIITVFGMSTFTCLEPVNLCISDCCKVEGFLSKSGYGSGRNLGDRQFFFVNGRPVDMPKVSKLVNELYKGANSRQYPIAIVNFTVPAGTCDVNVTPDKRKIFFSDEGSIIQSLREALGKMYSSNHATYSVNSVEVLEKKENHSEISRFTLKQLPLDGSTCKEGIRSEKQSADGNIEDVSNLCSAEVIHRDCGSSTGRDFKLRMHNAKKASALSCSYSNKLADHLNGVASDQNAPLCSGENTKGTVDDISSRGLSNIVQETLSNFVTVDKRKHECISTTLSEVPILRNGPDFCESKEDNLEMHSSLVRSRNSFHEAPGSDEVNNGKSGLSKCSRIGKVLSEMNFHLPGVTPNNKKTGEVVKIQDDPLTAAELVSISSSKDAGNGSENTPNAAPPLQSLGPALDDPMSSSGLKVVKIQKDPLIAADSVSISFSEDAGDGSEYMLDTDSPLQPPGPALGAPMPSSGLKVGPTLQFSFQDLMTRRQQRMSILQSTNHASRRLENTGYAAATLELSQSTNEEGKMKALGAATRELERLFKKDDFGQMKVIGQFNLGFIIAKLNQDLFIVDQHAADEKYNYECLSQSTILNQQPLLRPLSIELSPEEEIVVSMHMDTIRKNGFTLEEDMHARPGQRFKLKAVPFSKNITFGVSDVRELISILADSQGECSMIGTYRMDTSDSICPPRLRAMLASRACRSSIRIGDALGRNEMQKILEHLAELKSPWNCPHGRPTMRHLVDLTTVHKRFDEDDATW